MKSKIKFKFLKLLTFLILVTISSTGSDCSNLTEDNNVIPQEIIGDWKLIEQTGALQDICPDETVNYQSSGIATLTCPSASAITRNYQVVNSVLTYTQTSISYGMEILDNGNLYLTGQNVSRNLKYQKITSSEQNKSVVSETQAMNSSEGDKIK